MPRPTIKSLTAELEYAHNLIRKWEESFNRLSDGYAEGVARIATHRGEIEDARHKQRQAEARATEAERRLKKAERCASQFAFAMESAINVIERLTRGETDDE